MTTTKGAKYTTDGIGQSIDFTTRSGVIRDLRPSWHEPKLIVPLPQVDRDPPIEPSTFP